MNSDQKAAEAFLAEMRTRIATQPLPFKHGDETAALNSLYSLFGLAREIIKANPGCRDFADLADKILNEDIRPFTARWHKLKVDGHLQTRNGAVEFRAALVTVQNKLNSRIGALRQMAYGEEEQEQTRKVEAAFEMRRNLLDLAEIPLDQKLLETTEALKPKGKKQSPMVFGIPKNDLIDEEAAAEINSAETEEIRAMRTANGKRAGPKNAPITDAAGLAFSGGGIRSATFCLGIAQVLADKNLFEDFDIMSTVSGGGYTGAFITRRLGDKGPPPETSPKKLFGKADGPDTEEVAYVRNRAAYLSMESPMAMFLAACRLLGGTLHNWSAPAFVIAVLVWISLAVNWLGPDIVWSSLPLYALYALGGGVVVFGLLSFFRGAGRFAVGLFAAAVASALALLSVWLVHCLYQVVDEWFQGVSLYTALLPAFLAFLPTLGKILPTINMTIISKALSVGALIIAAVAIPAAALLFGFYLFNLGYTSIDGDPSGACKLLAFTVILIVLTVSLNINVTGPHGLYRARLARTFVAKKRSDNEDVALGNLNQTQRAPYHLINAAINLPSSKSVRLRERKSDFFLFSKHFCGSPTTGYFASDTFKNGRNDMDIATAVAVSGAAVAPIMALNTIAPVRMLLAFLNIRLGFWLRQPNLKPWVPKPVPGLLCLLREMFGFDMDEAKPWINLSDGGHIENSGIYELLRRRVRYIVAVDGGQDGGNDFATLTTLIRHARLDLGVKIDPAFDLLRADEETGQSPAHSVLTEIHYPATDSEPEGSTGLLLVLKLALTGDESELIKGYHRAHPNFPHQSTADQFFDEAQFEAYRQLGVHSANELFKPAMIDHAKKPETVSGWLAQLSKTILASSTSN